MFAVYRALEIGKEREYKIVSVCSDYNQMRKKLKNSYEARIGFNRNDLHGEIMRITRNFELVQFAYKPRRKNQMAHTLARRARHNEIPIIRDDLNCL
jgi:ribonuclease HI